MAQNIRMRSSGPDSEPAKGGAASHCRNWIKTLKTAHKTYPGVSLDLMTVLLLDQFIDAVDSPQLKYKVKQGKPASLQGALASAMKFESMVKSSPSSLKIYSTSDFVAQRQCENLVGNVIENGQHSIRPLPWAL